MRRALPFAAIAIPVVVLAALTAGSGQVLETDNYDAVSQISYINAAACAETTGQTLLSLQWNTITLDKSSPTTGQYKIFSSNTAPSTSTTAGANQFFCPEADDPNKSPPIKANQVGDPIPATSSLQSASVSAVTAVTNAGFTCDSNGEGKDLWVCAHWFNASSTREGYASGKFQIQVAKPSAPTSVTAGSGDGRLAVSWSPSTGGAAPADHYVAKATAGGQTFYSTSTTGTTADVTGLQNGTQYAVVVVAYSIGGNPSDDSSPPAYGTPVPAADFWKTYKERGGVETGGCASGPSGLLALGGVASLLVLRRRRR